MPPKLVTPIYEPFSSEKKTHSDYSDGAPFAQEKKPDPESAAANENSDTEADREPVKPHDRLLPSESPRNSPSLTRRKPVSKRGIPPRQVSIESDDIDYLTPEMVCIRCYND
jgi:hypothetical protein